MTSWLSLQMAALILGQQFTVTVANPVPKFEVFDIRPAPKADKFEVAFGAYIRPWLSPKPYPKGALKYEPTKWTQEIAVTNGYDRISYVPIAYLPDRRWHQSGGMEGIEGVRSDKYKLIPGGKAESWVGNIAVWNGANFQDNRGIIRRYPDETRFDDVLSYNGKVFEHRVRFKRNGEWLHAVIHNDPTARPLGYKGLLVSCADCHSEPGTGGYAAGLVPGGDTVFSDELDWSLVGRR